MDNNETPRSPEAGKHMLIAAGILAVATIAALNMEGFGEETLCLIIPGCVGVGALVMGAIHNLSGGRN